MEKIGLYCNWKVKAESNGFYINPIHAKYLDALLQKKYQVTLMSNTCCERVEGEIYYPYSEVSLVKLPNFNSYMKGFLYIKSIIFGCLKLLKNNDRIYIRTFEPASWLFSLLNFTGSNLHYHIVSNPISVILANRDVPKLIRYIRVGIFYPEYILTLVAAKANHFTCNGASVLSNLPKFFRKSARVIIESSLSQGDFYQNISRDNLPVTKILCVGYIRPAKGVDVLIKALKVIAENHNVTLSIVGDGSYKGEMIALAEGLNVHDICEFHGFVPTGQDLNEFYRSHDIFVMPSFSETGPRVVLEAMANSIYCISTDVGYAPDVLSKERGMIIPINSVSHIVDSVTYFINNRTDLNDKISSSYHYSKSFTLRSFFEDVFKD
ncbi:glycosyltransferase family 4 protein [Paraglaciecola chathamensis]|uniref:Glycosyltransferase family 4 protein n=1 Tax=Paraglaciecola chathamensis TaxID=368405 RepID=A0ABS0WAG6_9ALTE|nr:glycosyltransferase [Paraglaciecola chathamensis]MBJ2135412.1 glycosyltransferase family 4 protein [Paraglaciecola chathamensis]